MGKPERLRLAMELADTCKHLKEGACSACIEDFCHRSWKAGRLAGLEAAAKVAHRWVTAGMHAIGNNGLSRAPTEGLENMRWLASEIEKEIRALAGGKERP